MRFYGPHGLILIIGAILCLSPMVFAQTGQGEPGRFDPRAMCQKRFDKIDTNIDGTVDKEEFMAAQEEMFRMRDGDSNGQLTKEEFCPERPAGMGMGMGPKKQ